MAGGGQKSCGKLQPQVNPKPYESEVSIFLAIEHHNQLQSTTGLVSWGLEAGGVRSHAQTGQSCEVQWGYLQSRPLHSVT